MHLQSRTCIPEPCLNLVLEDQREPKSSEEICSVLWGCVSNAGIRAGLGPNPEPAPYNASLPKGAGRRAASTILYYTILYYTILYYTILSYAMLYYTILCYTILYYTILYYTILYYTTTQHYILRLFSGRPGTRRPCRSQHIFVTSACWCTPCARLPATWTAV